MINSIHLLRRRTGETPTCDGSGERIEVDVDSGSYAPVACTVCRREFTGRVRRTFRQQPLQIPVVRVPRHAPPEKS